LHFLVESNNPTNRLKGMLPVRTVVAHKTGTGGNQNGVTSATNDVGIITLPNGNHVAIAVFVGDSKADLATREAVIAKIAKAVFDKWSQTPSTEPVKQANFNERHTLN
jgi:beta-lactamase class A